MTADRPTHLVPQDQVEQLAFDGGYDIERGTDRDGDYMAVVTREGTTYKARLAEVGA